MKKTNNFLIAICALIFIWFWSDKMYYEMEARKQRIHFKSDGLMPSWNSELSDSELIPNGIVIYANHQGHFTGTVLINNVKMPFMIDTGATSTTVPAELAKKANMPFYETIKSYTANGIAYGQASEIKSLKLGNAIIINIDGHINYKFDQVLIGMNALKLFSVEFDNEKITLIAR